MIAGGIGNIYHQNRFKKQIQKGDLLIVLGGPGFLIGIGGGATSSTNSGLNSNELDYASVQRESRNTKKSTKCFGQMFEFKK